MLKYFKFPFVFFSDTLKTDETEQTEPRQTSAPSQAAGVDLQKSGQQLLQRGQRRTDLALQSDPLQRTLFSQFGSSERDGSTVGIPQKGQRRFFSDLGAS